MVHRFSYHLHVCNSVLTAFDCFFSCSSSVYLNIEHAFLFSEYYQAWDCPAR
jgi:hypothetical protein